MYPAIIDPRSDLVINSDQGLCESVIKRIMSY